MTWIVISCSSNYLIWFPSQTNVSPQTQSPDNCSTLCNLPDHPTGGTPQSLGPQPSYPCLPFSHAGSIPQVDTAQWEGGVIWKTKLFTELACRLVMICVQYDVHHLPPSFHFSLCSLLPHLLSSRAVVYSPLLCVVWCNFMSCYCIAFLYTRAAEHVCV